ncbi:MAG: hypothetical protein APF78_06185 [Sphingomonadales bacterium BRH_c3]|nr:MAG: hypothetical protein APF78_06185 [Sphingomonadales bacterium BRH_c3]
MRAPLKTAAALLALVAAPLAARSPTNEQIEVMNAVHGFFDALRSDDKTALAQHMLPDGVIFIHNRIKPDQPRVDVVPVTDHLARWAKSPADVDEIMHIETVMVDGDMAQVWGPYYFEVEDKLNHCGFNSLSMIKTADGWKVANTSFSMEPPERCDALVAEVNSHWEFYP